MASIDITRSYTDGEALLEPDLDAIQTDLTTFFNTTKVNDDNIQGGGIRASTKLASASISTAKLTDGTVTSAKIAASAITTAKIADGAVTAAKLADGAVTTAKIATGSLVAADFADNAVTAAKRSNCNLVVASSGITNPYSTTTTSEESVTNATLSITTTGNPVFVGLNAPAVVSYIRSRWRTSAGNQMVRIYRDSTKIMEMDLDVVHNTAEPTFSTFVFHPANSFFVIDQPAAGTYTYTLRLLTATIGNISILGGPKLYAFEMT